MHPGMRRMMWKQMMREMAGHGWQHGPKHGDWQKRGYGEWDGPSLEDRIAYLEEYQRDLEQEVADVASKIKKLKERAAAEETKQDSDG